MWQFVDHLPFTLARCSDVAVLAAARAEYLAAEPRDRHRTTHRYFAEDGELKGLLRMTCSTAYGERFVAPAVNSFMLNHPKLSILIELDDAVRDIVSEGFDLAIRFGRLTDSRLIAKRLASRTRRLCAAPAYLARAGAPRTIDELSRHACVLGAVDTWPLREPVKIVVP